MDSCYDYLFEYENICYNDCPIGTHRIFQNRNICTIEVPENYYLDNNDNIFKECYNTCKKCSQSGDETINNCDECKEGFLFLNESSVPSHNCYQKCEHYFYYDENNQYICTESNMCLEPYNILIEQKKKCIDECKNDDEYAYNYNNTCVKKCPDNTKIDIEEKKCLESCSQNQIEVDGLCYNSIPNDFQQSFQFNDKNLFMSNTPSFTNKLNNILMSAY